MDPRGLKGDPMGHSKKFPYIILLGALSSLVFGCTKTDERLPSDGAITIERLAVEIRPIIDESLKETGSYVISSSFPLVRNVPSPSLSGFGIRYKSPYFSEQGIRPKFEDINVLVNGVTTERSPPSSDSSASSIIVPLSSGTTKAGMYSVLIRMKVRGLGRASKNGERIFFPLTGAQFPVRVGSYEVRFVPPSGVKIPRENVFVRVTDKDNTPLRTDGSEYSPSNDFLVVRGGPVEKYQEIGFIATW